VSYCHVSLSEISESSGGKHLFHQTDIRICSDGALVVHYYSAALLSPVLEGKETVIAGVCQSSVTAFVFGIYPEYAAFFM
jgi:hypothetical protein